MKQVTLRYFAVMREAAGRPEEQRATEAATLAELLEELRAAYGLRLHASNVRAAVGERYVPLDTPVTDGMDITFIPPVSGG